MSWGSYGYSGWNTAAYRQHWPVWKAFVLEIFMPGSSWAYLGKWAVAFGVMVATGVIGGVFGGLAAALAAMGAEAPAAFVRLFATPAVLAWYWYNASKTHAFAPVPGGAKRAAAWILGWYAAFAALLVCGILLVAAVMGTAAGDMPALPERGQAAGTQVAVMVSPPAPRVGDVVTFDVFATGGKVQCVVFKPELETLVDVLYTSPPYDEPVGRNGAWGACWNDPQDEITITAQAMLSGSAGTGEPPVYVMDPEGQWWQVETALSVQP